MKRTEKNIQKERIKRIENKIEREDEEDRKENGKRG